MRKFFAKHRIFTFILLGYLAPILIIACLFVLSFFFALVSPETLLSEWFLKITVNSIILCLLWLFLLTLSLIVCVVFDRMGGSARSFGRTVVEGALTFIRDPRRFLAKHRTLLILIFLGYLIPTLIYVCFFTLAVFFVPLPPPNLLAKWIWGVPDVMVFLYFPWLFAWSLFWAIHLPLSRVGSRPRDVLKYVSQNKLPSLIFLIILWVLSAFCWLWLFFWSLSLMFKSQP